MHGASLKLRRDSDGGITVQPHLAVYVRVLRGANVIMHWCLTPSMAVALNSSNAITTRQYWRRLTSPGSSTDPTPRKCGCMARRSRPSSMARRCFRSGTRISCGFAAVPSRSSSTPDRSRRRPCISLRSEDAICRRALLANSCESARCNDPARFNDISGLSCRSASGPHADSQPMAGKARNWECLVAPGTKHSEPYRKPNARKPVKETHRPQASWAPGRFNRAKARVNPV